MGRMVNRMKTFTLNSKLIPAKELDFNFMCDLEDDGISMEDIEKKPMSILRAYVGYCMGSSKSDAGKIIEQHIINGGSLDDVAKILTEAMDDSGFFRALTSTEEEKATTRKKAPKVVKNTEV